MSQLSLVRDRPVQISPLARPNGIPKNILADIFSFVANDPDAHERSIWQAGQLYPNMERAPSQILSRVCLLWREVAVERCPALWWVLPMHMPGLARNSLARSSNHPLVMRFRLDGHRSVFYLPIIVALSLSELHRVEELVMEYDQPLTETEYTRSCQESFLIYLYRLCGAEFPSLKRLSISNHRLSAQDSVSDPPSTPPFLSSKALAHIQQSAITRSPFRHILPPALHTLQLENCALFADLDAFLCTLAQLPRLVQLEVTSQDKAFDVPSTPYNLLSSTDGGLIGRRGIHLRQLQDLKLGENLLFIYGVFPLLDFPSTANVFLTGRRCDPPIQSMWTKIILEDLARAADIHRRRDFVLASDVVDTPGVIEDTWCSLEVGTSLEGCAPKAITTEHVHIIADNNDPEVLFEICIWLPEHEAPCTSFDPVVTFLERFPRSCADATRAHIELPPPAMEYRVGECKMPNLPGMADFIRLAEMLRLLPFIVRLTISASTGPHFLSLLLQKMLKRDMPSLEILELDGWCFHPTSPTAIQIMDTFATAVSELGEHSALSTITFFNCTITQEQVEALKSYFTYFDNRREYILEIGNIVECPEHGVVEGVETGSGANTETDEDAGFDGEAEM